EFKESKLLGINLSDASLGNVSFENCNCNLSAFGYAALKQVKFDHCSLESADYYDCKFKKVMFDTCKLNEVNFSRTPL
ncbi:pentapeptide repeat-containing protein, partial [Leifsonia sp. SIMBA_070]